MRYNTNQSFAAPEAVRLTMPLLVRLVGDRSVLTVRKTRLGQSSLDRLGLHNTDSSPASRTIGESRKALPVFASRSLLKRLFRVDFRINPQNMVRFNPSAAEPPYVPAKSSHA